MKALVIYSLVPENLYFYAIPIEEKEILKVIKKLNGVTINVGPDLSDELQANFDWFNEIAEGTLKQFEIKTEELNQPFESVTYIEFYL